MLCVSVARNRAEKWWGGVLRAVVKRPQGPEEVLEVLSPSVIVSSVVRLLVGGHESSALSERATT